MAKDSIKHVARGAGWADYWKRGYYSYYKTHAIILQVKDYIKNFFIYYVPGLIKNIKRVLVDKTPFSKYPRRLIRTVALRWYESFVFDKSIIYYSAVRNRMVIAVYLYDLTSYRFFGGGLKHFLRKKGFPKKLPGLYRTKAYNGGGIVEEKEGRNVKYPMMFVNYSNKFYFYDDQLMGRRYFWNPTRFGYNLYFMEGISMYWSTSAFRLTGLPRQFEDLEAQFERRKQLLAQHYVHRWGIDVPFTVGGMSTAYAPFHFKTHSFSLSTSFLLKKEFISRKIQTLFVLTQSGQLKRDRLDRKFFFQETILNAYTHLYISKAVSQILRGLPFKLTVRYSVVPSAAAIGVVIGRLLKKKNTANFAVHVFVGQLLKASGTKIKGACVRCAGRLTKSRRKSVKWYRFGVLNSANMMESVDYSETSIILKYGIITIRVWLTRQRSPLEYEQMQKTQENAFAKIEQKKKRQLAYEAARQRKQELKRFKFDRKNKRPANRWGNTKSQKVIDNKSKYFKQSSVNNKLLTKHI